MGQFSQLSRKAIILHCEPINVKFQMRHVAKTLITTHPQIIWINIFPVLSRLKHRRNPEVNTLAWMTRKHNRYASTFSKIQIKSHTCSSPKLQILYFLSWLLVWPQKNNEILNPKTRVRSPTLNLKWHATGHCPSSPANEVFRRTNKHTKTGQIPKTIATSGSWILYQYPHYKLSIAATKNGRQLRKQNSLDGAYPRILKICEQKLSFYVVWTAIPTLPIYWTYTMSGATYTS